MDVARNDFRRRVNERFLSRRRTAVTEAYTYSYEQALQLMKKKDVFDVTKEPPRDFDRYGTSEFGRHCLMARRLLEKGATFVQVSHSNYDTHNENFDFHIEQLGEFDRAFSALLADLARSRHARQHADRRRWRVRPHAAHQPSITAAITGRRPGASRWRAPGSSAARSMARPTTTAPRSWMGRSIARTCSTPTSRPWGSTRPIRSTSRGARCRSRTRRPRSSSRS